VVGGVKEEVERTTPEAIDLQATFKRMLDAGDTAAAMEVSSHALELGRVAGVRFACKLFTNLTQDHLDFHHTMDAYFAAKRRLFDEHGVAVVNVDDEHGRRIAAELDAITFGIETDADYRAREIEFDFAGSHFLLDTPDGEVEVESPLPGLFNVLNVVGAIAAVRSLGVEDISLDGFERVPGRFEPVDEGQDFGVLVDYAHTPDSLENVLRTARELTRGRLHVVFGAGGDRDPTKRPLMGRAARELADRVLVTSDNPRNEQPEAIIDQVMEGAGPDAERDADRRRAIGRAIADAEPGDVVVIAGKGHEQGQEFENGRKEPFDDVGVAREALRARLGARA